MEEYTQLSDTQKTIEFDAMATAKVNNKLISQVIQDFKPRSYDINETSELVEDDDLVKIITNESLRKQDL